METKIITEAQPSALINSGKKILKKKHKSQKENQK